MSSSPKLSLIAMLCGVFIAASDLTVVTTILPQIIFDLQIPLRTGLSQAAWIVNAYLIAYTVTMPFMGRVSDVLGRRNAYWICLALFSIGSLIAGMARTLEWMLVGRAVQALGAGAMVPVTMAYVADVLPLPQRPFMLGLVGAIDTAGWVIGPLYGAAMVLRFHWQWVFYINAPFSIVVGVALLAWLRENQSAQFKVQSATAISKLRATIKNQQSLDWLGALTLSLALITLTLAFSGVQSDEGGSLFAGQAGFNPYAIPLIVSAIISLSVFVWQERRAASPLIPLTMFADRTFNAACVANFMVGGALMIAMVNVPLFVNIAVAPTLADAPWLSGSALAVFTGGMVCGSLGGGWVTGRAGYRAPAWLGLAFAACGFVVMSQWQLRITLADMLIGLMVCGVGFGFVISPLASAAINSVSEAQRGIASAMVLIQRLIGMALGLAALTTWGVNRLNELTARLPPSNLANPAEAARILLQQALQLSAQVITEIFLLTAGLCALACLPVFLMRANLQRDEVRSWLGWR
jgi:MFS family permease